MCMCRPAMLYLSLNNAMLERFNVECNSVTVLNLHCPIVSSIPFPLYVGMGAFLPVKPPMVSSGGAQLRCMLAIMYETPETKKLSDTYLQKRFMSP
jgi:hypothetical protein